MNDREREEYTAHVAALVRVGVAAVEAMPIAPTNYVQIMRTQNLLRAGRAFLYAYEETQTLEGTP